MMDEKDECNGWSNEETWALDQWLSNNEYLYKMVGGKVKITRYRTGTDETIKKFIEGLKGTEEFKSMFDDVGDMKRVNWKELADVWKEDEEWG